MNHEQRVLIVNVPADTPAGSSIYIAGDFNGWNAAHSPAVLKRREDGRYEFAPPPDVELMDYKLTRGSWDSVECAADGSQVGNRTWTKDVNGEVIHVGSWCDLHPAARRPKHTVTGDLRIIKDVFAPQLGNLRDLLVWLPPHYDEQKEMRYPVLYMHDGQNLFDEVTAFDKEWGADEVSTELALEGLAHIIVGIPNVGVGRLHEYSPFPDDFRKSRGHGERYVRFLLQTVKPLVDRYYRTKPAREFTAIGGSSLGGLISLYAGLTRPDVFGCAACLSPTMNVAGGRILKLAQAFRGDAAFWLDYGAREFGGNKELSGQMIEAVQTCARHLDSRGATVKCVIDPQGEHNETSWRSRLPDVLRWWHEKLPH